MAAWCNIDFTDIYSNPLYYAHNLHLNGEKVTKLVIPDGVTSISKIAFEECYGLTSVEFPNSVKSIGEHAFFNCYGLTSLDITEGVKSIGGTAFACCSGLTSITIPKSVTSIGGNAFLHCSGLTSVNIHDVAAWCNVDFGSNVFSSVSNPLCYAQNLYLNGEKVTELVIPDGVTSIGNVAFYGYNSLTSITIPTSVKSIGEDVFLNCNSLSSIYSLNPIPPKMGRTLFMGTKVRLYVPNEALEAYRTAEHWKQFRNIQGIDVKK